VISASEANAFKPRAATYAKASEIIGIKPSQILFVANHVFVCVGAKAAGCQAAFIDRRKRPLGNSKYPADIAVQDMAELAKVVQAEVKVAEVAQPSV
jgi:2-haloacid dehalogenase